MLVNRVWMNHFGKGLVATPGDFGRLGEKPSHPELLDWLADDFVRNGWRLKHLHRLIMTSTAYRQASRRDPALDAIDPDNRLLGRMSVRRLEAEAVRDAILAVSGKLDPTMFGPPLPVAPDEAGQVLIGKDTRDSAGRPTGPPGSLGDAEFRRSLYVQVRRSLPLGFTESFDVPSLSPNCERRETSTVATQSLALMNSEFSFAQATDAAERVARIAGADPSARVRHAWRLALSREPDDEQVAEAVAFLAEQRAEFARTPTPEREEGQGGARRPGGPRSPRPGHVLPGPLRLERVPLRRLTSTRRKGADMLDGRSLSSRRHFLARQSMGLGSLALAWLLDRDGARAAETAQARPSNGRSTTSGPRRPPPPPGPMR